MNPLLRSSTTHLFREDITGEIGLDDDTNHVEKVLRVRDGESITVSDGRGRWRVLRYVSSGGLRHDSEIYVETRAPRETCVAFAPVKGDRTEWTVEKLTEIGIDRIVVMTPTVRSVVRWDGAKTDAQRTKLTKTVLAAASQSRRVWLPVVDVGVAMGSLSGAGVAVAEPGGAVLDESVTTVVVGPEGGFAPEEIENWTRVTLGDTILRAETASVVAATLLVAHSRRQSDHTV